MKFIGIDIGSTTVKLSILDNNYNLVFGIYQRHFSDIKKTIRELIAKAYEEYPHDTFKVSMTGSGGLSLSTWLGVDFIQEVIASVKAVEHFIEGTDVVIELGGEDAKITYFKNGIDQRMNGTCAGGTGAFIDQMAALLNTDAPGLNELAKNYSMVYPIAARCGVFARSDVQPLLNEGAKKEDIAKSIFKAVVNQTISGLACGMPIRGKVVFLGGPLTFLSELGLTFKESLNLSDENAVFPINSEYYVAMGAAIGASENIKEFKLLQLVEKFNTKMEFEFKVDRLTALFDNQKEYSIFKERHVKNSVKRVSLKEYKGNAFLGIDCGSTTTKMVLCGQNDELLYEFYSKNEGEPLRIIKNALLELMSVLPNDIKIKSSCSTGYGEALIKAALNLDYGEIETVCHQRAAEYFLPGVDFILDIGGQDMKCISAKNGVIYSVLLNEACSAGCGSFLENFASSLHLDIQDFVSEALKSMQPVDLGSRCTVFMNSKVKQAQKEGATVADIAAGLAYSVVKNSLYKVIRLKSVEELGEKVIVQGGTFLNDAVLRAFEKLIGKEVVRPDIAGIMGAFGCALIAKDRFKDNYQSSMINHDLLSQLNLEPALTRCGLCANNCGLSIYRFNNNDVNDVYITGNRCESGLAKYIPIKKNELPNLYQYKYKKLFSYKSLAKGKKTIGLPRVLNMYENYPFWHTFLTELGYKVVLSSKSSKIIYDKGIETIPSESACYPAKITHGHIMDLVDKKVDIIFYPSVFFESKEVKAATNQYNCPIVMSYPEVIKHNVDDIETNSIQYLHPFISFHDKKAMLKSLVDCFTKLDDSKDEIILALQKAYLEDRNFKEDIKKKGEEVVKYCQDNNLTGIVLAGRPYHIDPEINHKLDEMICAFGYPILTEDSIYHLGDVERPLLVVDQWVYHSRLYMAADFVSKNKNLEMVQLNSFGCGLDAVTTDQVKLILERRNKIYTCLKIDEVSNLGSARIRIRSLKAAIDLRKDLDICLVETTVNTKHLLFTKEMKKDYTILVPQMSPIHFNILEPVLKAEGYNIGMLHNTDNVDLEYGLKYVHNDACYPSLLVVGQLIRAVDSGVYDPNKVALIITQTGGGCRATNYIAFIRKALADAGYPQVPVIGLGSIEKHPGFKIGLRLIQRLIKALLFGDALMRISYKQRPYEINKGDTNNLVDKWTNYLIGKFSKKKPGSFKKDIYQMIKEFDEIVINKDLKKPRVGLVGEILVKFHPYANNNVVNLVENEGGEAVMPDLYDFFLYSMQNGVSKAELFNYKTNKKFIYNLIIKIMEYLRKDFKIALEKSENFEPFTGIKTVAHGASQLLSLGHQTGEGWFLTGEMVELIEADVNNIICMQPFACLPNHVTGKGMIKALRKKYPFSNVVAIDYDPGASEVNQINRIKLMMAVAFKNLKEIKQV